MMNWRRCRKEAKEKMAKRTELEIHNTHDMATDRLLEREWSKMAQGLEHGWPTEMWQYKENQEQRRSGKLKGFRIH